jgi:hypothetical protein
VAMYRRKVVGKQYLTVTKKRKKYFFGLLMAKGMIKCVVAQRSDLHFM